MRAYAAPTATLPPAAARLALRLLAVLMGLLGLGLTVLGALVVLGGATPYYLLAGLASLAAAALAWRGRSGLALGVFGALVAASLAWSLWELAGKGWMPAWMFDLGGRVGLLALLLALLWLTHAWAVGPGQARRGALLLALPVLGLPLLAVLVWLVAATERPQSPTGGEALPPPSGQSADAWTAYGGSNLAQRHVNAVQITPQNVAQLELAWQAQTGDMPRSDRVFYSAQNTPLKVGDLLYVCTPSNQVLALDAASGAKRWHFDPKVSPIAMEPLFSVACRAVGYHHSPTPATPAAACDARVFVATTDSRLIALDALTGLPCADFGHAGTVDLAEGMGNQAVGLSSTTSGPAVVGNRVLVGQQVSDNQRRDAPSGVVRAYDAQSGALVWAWDALRPDAQAPLAAGAVYPRGTPNVWTLISADDNLGLAYLATGNAANDHWGGDRRAEEDRYTASVVAVDIATGATRWHFTTVVHDLWDYDLAAQPTVLDMPIGGQTRRVVLQGTKTGSLFVLDAATGEPLRPVQMVPSPQGALPGERLAPAQPQSTDYPNFAGRPGPNPERLDERHAFGVTPLDAAWCRWQFTRFRYEGIYTPPTDRDGGTLLFPGTIGGLNWGGLAVDTGRQIVVTNHSRLPNRVTLIPRAQVHDQAVGSGGHRIDQKVAPQAGAPYGVDRPMWLSPLGVPCIAPPWGYLSATDLQSGRLLWTQPLGTGYDSGPLNIPTRLRIPVGTPNIGGAVTTRSGLTFIAAAQDNFLRAYETRTGALLWSARLPAGAQASPMTYEHGGRQYVAIVAAGHARLGTQVGDHLLVYALPDAP